MSHAMCDIVTCHMLHVIFFLFLQNGFASQRRVCYQQGLPRLALLMHIGGETFIKLNQYNLLFRIQIKDELRNIIPYLLKLLKIDMLKYFNPSITIKVLYSIDKAFQAAAGFDQFATMDFSWAQSADLARAKSAAILVKVHSDSLLAVDRQTVTLYIAVYQSKIWNIQIKLYRIIFKQGIYLTVHSLGSIGD